MNRSGNGNQQYKAFLALQKTRRTKTAEPVEKELTQQNPHVVNNPHFERPVRMANKAESAVKIQALARGFLTRKQFNSDRQRSVFVTNVDDKTFGAEAKKLASSGQFDVFNTAKPGELTPLNREASGRRLVPPAHTAVLLHGAMSAKGPKETKNLGAFSVGGKQWTAEKVRDSFSALNILPAGKDARITSLACWSGADAQHDTRVSNKESFGQKLATATGVPVTAPNGSLAIGSKGSKEFPQGMARVNLSMNNAGDTTSRQRAFSDLVAGTHESLHTEKTKKKGGVAWQRFEPLKLP